MGAARVPGQQESPGRILRRASNQQVQNDLNILVPGDVALVSMAYVSFLLLCFHPVLGTYAFASKA